MSRNVLAIDIGSTKICAVIAQIAHDGTISISGSGTVKAQGLKKGSITNIELAARSIKSAVEDAKRVSGSTVSTAIVSISGAYTKSLNSNGIVNIQSKEISLKEIQRVMHTSLYNANIPNEYEVLHALPYNFKVDDQDFIEDPLGMNASRLEVETHIITTQKSNLNNLKKAVQGAGVEVENVVLAGYASSIATINSDEKELGAAVIDMGGNTCNITIHSGNAIRYNEFLAVGSNHVTNDLSMALHTPLNVADEVKLKYCSLLSASDELIELPVIGDDNSTHEVSLEVVNNVIYARVEEALLFLSKFIEKSGLVDQITGVILTGGFSNMKDIRELAIATFGSIPIRLGRPKEIEGLSENLRSPEYSSVIGLVIYAKEPYTPYEIDVNKRVRHTNELASSQSSVDFKANEEISLNPLEEKKETKMLDINANKEKKSDEANFFSKFWNWATQLF